MWFNKKGNENYFLIFLLITIVILVVVVGIILVFKGKGDSLIVLLGDKLGVS